jgi:diaminohydroxyphosphoribosylaminopyrimidine deaminase/5-amino-6-(5-phosphoribosylamino)uracil reductase
MLFGQADWQGNGRYPAVLPCYTSSRSEKRRIRSVFMLTTVDKQKKEPIQKQHEMFMRRALRLAQKGEGYVSPNPAVGAVIVREGQVVGEGYHQRAGEAHAEAAALEAAGDAARGATLYVTLEPCNHYGRTPPCSEAIIKAGIAELYYAIPDPNPQVRGGGGRRLQEAGIRVHAGLCTDEARHLNRFFLHHAATGRPYVVAKFAASLDGKIATRTGDSQWITGPEARQTGHRLRHLCDGIAVGAGTAAADNPRLTTRLPDLPEARHPLRILLDSRGRVPLDARLLQPDLPGETLVAATEQMPLSRREALARRGVESLILPADDDGRVGLRPLLDELGRRGLNSLLLEGGGQLLGSFFAAGLVNEVWAFLAPLIIGGDAAPGAVRGLGAARLAEAWRLQNVRVEMAGRDILARGYLSGGEAA